MLRINSNKTQNTIKKMSDAKKWKKKNVHMWKKRLKEVWLR